MPKRALYEKRPYLLASIAVALAYYVLRNGEIAGVYLALIKGAALACLALYAVARHAGRDANWIASVMAIAALADVAIEFDETFGILFYFTSVVVAMGLFLRHRRPELTPSQKGAATVLLLTTPIISWILDPQLIVGLYGLALGGMAATAWASRFSRYHVGIGAVLFVAGHFLFLAQMNQSSMASIASWFNWPFYYCGQFLICTGVIQTLRRDHAA